jgi:prefoldin subunit 5
MARTLSLLLLVIGCTPDSHSSGEFTFLHPPPGKADGSELLPADQLQRLDDKLTAAIAGAQKEIDSLESQIAAGESQLTAKQNRIDDLVQQIQQRQQVVTQNYNNSLFVSALAAAFGLFPVGALGVAQALQQDSLLQQLNQQLADAKSQRDQVKSQIASYQQKRDNLRTRLDDLKKAHTMLATLLVSGSFAAGAPPDGVDLDQWSQVAAERGRVDTLQKIYANTQQQISLLQQILQLVNAANAAVDDALATVKALADAADAEAQKSTESFQQFLQLALGDPDMSLEDWLQDQLSARVRQALGQLSWAASPFVDYLMGNSDDAQLRESLIESFVQVTLTADKPNYAPASSAHISFHGAPGGKTDWIGLYPRGASPSGTSLEWSYAGASGWTPHTAAPVQPDGLIGFYFANAGQFTVYYFSNDQHWPLASLDIDVR